MKGFFDYGIADEVHELSNDTAQGNALGTLARAVDKIAVLTGTLMGGYADDLFNVLYRLEPHKMAGEGYEWGESGVRSFAETYGVLETSNDHRARRKCLLEGEGYQAGQAQAGSIARCSSGSSSWSWARSFRWRISPRELPSYREEVIGVDMDEPLAKAYTISRSRSKKRSKSIAVITR